MTKDSRQNATAQPRVATRRGVGGHAERRRRTFQIHLLAFLAGNLAVAAIDAFVIAPPNVQWAQWFITPWAFVFLLHVLGLKSRGFTWGELVIPPKEPEIREIYTAPLEYEVIRARQLRDGVSSAAASVRDSHPELADAALAAADALVEAVEELMAMTSSGGRTQRATELLPETQAALTALDELHRGLIGIGVLDAPAESVPIEPARERTDALRSRVGRSQDLE